MEKPSRLEEGYTGAKTRKEDRAEGGVVTQNGIDKKKGCQRQGRQYHPCPVAGEDRPEAGKSQPLI